MKAGRVNSSAVVPEEAWVVLEVQCIDAGCNDYGGFQVDLVVVSSVRCNEVVVPFKCGGRRPRG